jgi:hypothetical protein
VFSSHPVNENIIEHFIQKIPYRSYHLNLNEQNYYGKGVKQPNFILNLNKDYDTLFAAYSTNTKRNIKKAYRYNIEIKTGLLPDVFLGFYHSIEKKYTVSPKTNQIIQEFLKKDKITIYGAYNADNKLISTLCLLHSSHRLIYLLPISNKEGKDTLAMFRIVDEIIQNHANSCFLFDFSGTNVKSIARFYEGFGAELKSYHEIKNWSINDFITRFCFWI